jgi:hypothetical protein
MWLEGHVDMTRCLIVDDNHDDRLKLAGMLAAYGFELTAATGEQEALEICSRKMPELIVIDEGRTCRMPQLSSAGSGAPPSGGRSSSSARRHGKHRGSAGQSGAVPPNA